MMGLVVLPRSARPMRQGTADRGNRTILKPDFQTGHPKPRIDHLRAGFSPDSVCLIGRKSPTPTPSPKPSQTGKADSCFLFWHGAGGQKTLEGEPWFVAADVCRALGLGNSSDVIKRLDEDERTLVSIEGASNGLPVNAVNEPGLYALILGSRKPEAKAFKRWITHEVIPSIRKTGGYIAGQETMGSIIPTSSLRA